MDSETVRGQVRKLVRDMAPRRPIAAVPTDKLADDLGYDSLAIIELSMRIEAQFDVAAGEGEQAGTDIVTVADVEELVLRLTRTAAPGAA